MHIKEQNRDAQGDLYEYLLSELKTAGKNGQFRTPRHIIRMMVELTDPKFGDNILDPACGTAGFLVSAYEHLLKNNTSKDLIKIDDEGNKYNFKADKLNPQQKQVLEDSTLYGFDIDPVMTRVSLMNLMMHGITKPNIEQKNTLSKSYQQNEHFDLILANPPFKGSIDLSELSDEFRTETKKTEILFLELMYNSLNHSGRCSVIVPDGVLFGNSKAHKAIRQLLLEKCSLDAVISMPSGVFKPYAGVSTAVLFFTKGQTTKKVWFYDMQADGFTLDDKRTKIDKNDIPDIIEKFNKRDKEKYEDRKAKCFFVPKEEIKKNDYDLSISKYKEIEYEEVKYDPPKEIKERIIKLENQIVSNLEELKI
jgi:type I restriction enzyme M protein